MSESVPDSSSCCCGLALGRREALVLAIAVVALTALVEELDNYVIIDVGVSRLQIMVVEERGLSHVRVSRMGADTGVSGVSASDPLLPAKRMMLKRS